MQLSEIAQILRCQVYRQAVPEDHDATCWELTPEDFKTVSGIVNFVPLQPKTGIVTELGPRSKKFLLEQNDIVVRMIGGMETVGEVAFAAMKVEKQIIPSKSLLIIRPNLKKIDPIWLYYRLSQNDIRTHLRDSATRNRPNYLVNATIKDIELTRPTELEIKTAHSAHKYFLESLWALEKRQEEERAEWRKLGEVLIKNSASHSA